MTTPPSIQSSSSSCLFDIQWTYKYIIIIIIGLCVSRLYGGPPFEEGSFLIKVFDYEMI